jgi:hypothetical protein
LSKSTFITVGALAGPMAQRPAALQQPAAEIKNPQTLAWENYQ